MKKYDDIKTHVDENLCKLASRFLSRKKREFIEYEMLYFMKEINKLSDEHVTELLVKVDNYLSKIKNLKNYISTLNKTVSQDIICEIATAILLKIIAMILNKNYKEID